MKITIDLSRAPKDATHYKEDPGAEHFVQFYKAEPAKLKRLDPDTGLFTKCHHGIVAGVVLPLPGTWKENALPPVGTKCQHIIEGPEEAWRDVEIIAHHQFENDPYLCAVWVDGDHISYSSSGDHFRPLPENYLPDAWALPVAAAMLDDGELIDLTMFQAIRLVKKGWRKP